MIITLTPNTGIDHTLQVPSFQLNSTIRAAGSAWGMGGKATDVSWILGRLGIPTRALGFAAGPNGQRMESMLRERGAETDFVWVEGETRLNTILIVSGEGQSTITTSTLRSPQNIYLNSKKDIRGRSKTRPVWSSAAASRRGCRQIFIRR
jgi:fructose-1-phosphate kinase PfkB-like protein